jgi:hypothetical protein
MPKTVEVCVAGTNRWHEAIIVDISSSDGTLTVEYPREYVPAETRVMFCRPSPLYARRALCIDFIGGFACFLFVLW